MGACWRYPAGSPRSTGVSVGSGAAVAVAAVGSGVGATVGTCVGDALGGIGVGCAVAPGVPLGAGVVEIRATPSDEATSRILFCACWACGATSGWDAATL